MWAAASKLASWSGTWKKEAWDIRGKKVWSRGVWTNICKMHTKEKDLCIMYQCQLEATHHSRGTLYMSRQMSWHFDVSQPLSVTTQWWYNEDMNSYWVVELKVMHIPSDYDSHLSRLNELAISVYQICQQQRPVWTLGIALFLEESNHLIIFLSLLFQKSQ